MTVIPITCDNCGAKYRLPPTFKGKQAKCQKCGSVIDVQKQREAAGDGDSAAAAAKPAAARPAAAAKPAVDRSKGRATAGKQQRTAAASGDSGRSAREQTQGDDEDTPRRVREKKKDNTPMIMAGGGLVAIIIVIVVMMMMNGDDPKETAETAQDNTLANTAKDDKDGTGDATSPGDADGKAANNAEDNAKPEDDGLPADGDAKKPEDPAPTPVDAGAPNTPKEPWEKQRNPPQTMGEVKSAAEMYGEVIWPESIEAAKKAEIMGIVSDLDVAGGIRSIRAKRKLVDAGYAGLFGILEVLHGLDYRQSSDAAFGFELNKALEDITGGLNTRYAAVQANEAVPPAKALWNTKTVNAWMKQFAKWPDAAAFKKAKAARAKKKRG